MRILIRLGVFIHLAIISIIGLLFLSYLAHFISIQDTVFVLSVLYYDGYYAMIAALVTAIIILKTLLFGRLIYGKQKKERTIAFDNPSGQVSISLSALEDLIRRLSISTTGIKEIRPNVIASKKGIQVEIRLILKADVNIPDLTGELQEAIKQKIQDVIGLEENVNIRIHVFKIVYDDPKLKRQKDKERVSDQDVKSESPQAPYHGYGSGG